VATELVIGPATGGVGVDMKTPASLTEGGSITFRLVETAQLPHCRQKFFDDQELLPAQAARGCSRPLIA